MGKKTSWKDPVFILQCWITIQDSFDCLAPWSKEFRKSPFGKICANRRKNPVSLPEHNTHENHTEVMFATSLFFQRFFVKSSTSSMLSSKKTSPWKADLIGLTSSNQLPSLECLGLPAYTAASSNSLGSKPPICFESPVFLEEKRDGWATKPIEKGPGLGANLQNTLLRR